MDITNFRLSDKSYASGLSWTLAVDSSAKRGRKALRNEARRIARPFHDDLAAYRISEQQFGTANRRHGHYPGMMVAAHQAALWLSDHAGPTTALSIVPVGADNAHYWIVGTTKDGQIHPDTDKVITSDEINTLTETLTETAEAIYAPADLSLPKARLTDPRRRPAPSLSEVLEFAPDQVITLEALGTRRETFIAWFCGAIVCATLQQTYAVHQEHIQTEVLDQARLRAISQAKLDAASMPPPWADKPAPTAALRFCWNAIIASTPEIAGWQNYTADCDLDSWSLKTSFNRIAGGNIEILALALNHALLPPPSVDYTGQNAETVALLRPRAGLPSPIIDTINSATILSEIVAAAQTWPDSTVQLNRPAPQPPSPTAIRDENGTPILPQPYSETRFKIVSNADPLAIAALLPRSGYVVTKVHLTQPNSWNYEGVVYARQ